MTFPSHIDIIYKNSALQDMSASAWPVQFLVFFSSTVLFRDENRLRENEVVIRYIISVSHF